MRRYYICLTYIGLSAFAYSQERLIDTVFISDKRLEEAGAFQKVIIVDKEIHKNASNLSETLRFQSPLYIKENGKGMVSSPSFRGTTAQQTAFVWNGININSIFLGQGDINNIGLLNFDRISIKPGGGSILYGTGAIGGSVHLDDQLTFNSGLKGQLFSEYGSFNTINSALKLSYSTDKLVVKLNTSIANSENDYEVPTERYKNINGKYYQYNYAISGAYRFNENHKIAIYTLWNTGLQHYPIFSQTQTRTKYATKGVKTMLNWHGKYGKVQNDLKGAFLREGYDYYSDISQPKSNGASGDTWLIRNDLSYQLSGNTSFNLLGEYQYNKAKGYNSGIINPSRNIGYTALVAKQNFGKKVLIEGALRKDFVENIESPWLYSLASKIEVSPHYIVKIKGSRNFRFPTFNDLYWQPGGNPALKPEISSQVEMTHQFRRNHWSIEIVPFYNHIENLIQWLPTSDAYWSPFNTRKVRSYGAEVYADIVWKVGRQNIKLGGSYAYNNSTNLETNKHLSYVPQHKATGNLSLKNKLLETYIQAMFTSTVFTTTDENKASALPHYTVINSGINFNLNKYINLGGRVNNIFNTVYKTSDYYPLPLRNFSINLTLNY